MQHSIKYLLLFSLLLTIGTLNSCQEEDPCEDTVCLNGGECSDGSCICPSGYSGIHCENSNSSGGNGGTGSDCDTCQWANDGVCDEPTYCAYGTDCTDCNGSSGGNSGSGGNNGGNTNNTSGYNCNNGNCNYVSSGAQYSSLSSCQNNCQSPRIMVWTSNSQPCPAGAGNVISVYINGNYAGSLNSYYPNEPSCGADGAVTREVSLGTHSIRAECGSRYWEGTTSVSNNGCYSIELN